MIITNSIRAVIFDLDGTLIDTAGEIKEALDRTFDELGAARLARKDVENLIGRGVRSMVERALQQAGASATEVEPAVERFEGHYAQTVGTGAGLYPGVLEGLRMLHGAGRRLGVVTNKPRFFTEKLLSRAGVDAFFTGLVAGDDGIRRKPHGDMLVAACRAMAVGIDETLMIGDSDNDVLAARAAGCRIWCVPYGYNEGRSPETLACERMVESVDAAARLLLGSA